MCIVSLLACIWVVKLKRTMHYLGIYGCWKFWPLVETAFLNHVNRSTPSQPATSPNTLRPHGWKSMGRELPSNYRHWSRGHSHAEEVLDIMYMYMHWPPKKPSKWLCGPDGQPLKVVGGTTAASQLPRLPLTWHYHKNTIHKYSASCNIPW